MVKVRDLFGNNIQDSSNSVKINKFNFLYRKNNVYRTQHSYDRN